MTEFERKPDGGLNAWIETYEAMRGDETDAEMLCLLLELRRRRENQAETERERDELRAGHTEAAKVISTWHNRAKAAEAELARRDAAAGEPVAFTHESEISNMHATGLYLRGFPADRRLNYEEGYTVALYTAALPAVLPPEVTEPVGEYCLDDGGGLAWLAGANWMREQCLALGAQQQKVVELPQPVKWPEVPFKYFSEEQVFSMLDAAGVKWEVRS